MTAGQAAGVLCALHVIYVSVKVLSDGLCLEEKLMDSLKGKKNVG